MPRRIRVFIVDDHPLVREWLGTLLRRQPDVDLCGEADDAIEALAAIVAAAPDVAVVDLSFKRGSGLDLIKQLREHAPQTRVLVLSMHEEINDVERALRAGARGYVTKRQSTTHIIPAIRQVDAGQVYADAGVLTAIAERAVCGTSRDVDEALATLSDRELEVFRRLGDGHSTRRIADDLQLSLKTVQTYCTRVREKLGLDDAVALVRAAVRWRAGRQP